jgi:serine/threonine protein kinase/tetratricopeptide (TPR) repeat protein
LIVADANRIIDLLHEAKARPAGAEREHFLAEACGQDAALKEQILSLLQAEAKEGESDFLRITRIIRQNIAPTEKPGDRIGRYKLLEQIGEGGCGVVYVAEQQEPVRRRVALKVIKLGMDTNQVIARFDAERQALAIMDHPNIAKVLDAGATGTGRPYFVMELVRGSKITDYCDQHQLSPRARLELFIQVCRAVQHAHQKGVMHRDIKPSNILVASDDGAPVPKVIDFGIAKATQGRLTDQTVYTAFEQFIGTPAYMSPEQAEMSLNEVDTRTDIYSLGVLLYELLTGKTPFDATELVASGLEAMRRTIREKEPARPSTRLSTMMEGELTSTARQRHTEAPRLIHLLRGDLDWVVMKCLEKDRTRRYETANGLAVDIQRHLSNEPVVARPPSGLYRFQKLVRRNKLAFAAASAVIAALVLGLGISTWLFFKEKQARQRAVAAEQEQARLHRQAEAEAARSQQVSQVLQDTLYSVSSAALRDRAVLQSILDTMAARIGRDLKQQPEVEAELSWNLGNNYTALGDYARAEHMYRNALAGYQQLFGRENPSVAGLLSAIADVASLQGREVESETLARQALALWKKLKDEEDPHVSATLDRLAMVYLRQSQTASSPVSQRLRTEAETLEREALRLRRKVFGDEGINTAWSLGNLGVVLDAQRRQTEGEPLIREALAIQRKLLGNDNLTVAMWLINLGDCLRSQGKHEEAGRLYREGLAMRRRLLGDEHPNVAYALIHLAALLQTQGKTAEAETLEREALAIYSKLPGDPLKIITLKQLITALQAQGKLAEAESPLRECLSILEQKTPDDWERFDVTSQLGGSLLAQRKYAEAEPLLLSGYEGMKNREEKIPTISRTRPKEALQRLVQLYEATEQSDKAAEWKEKLAEFDRAESEKKSVSPP